MVDAGIGRLLVASLHQGIADIVPMRLEFYEYWLTPPGMRDGRMGLAPLGAVLSFLRREGPGIYDHVMVRSGELSAEWAHRDLSGVERRLIDRLPAGLRTRGALGVSRRLVRATFSPSRATVRLKRGAGSIAIQDSVFCSLRETVSEPMCQYYAAAIGRLLALFHLDADVHVSQCRANGGAGCTLDVTIRGTRLEAPAAAEAA